MSGATPFDPVRLAIEGAIARLTLDQPARHNALGLAALEALESAIAQAEHTDGVRVLIIDAAPGPTFCAGAALDELADGRLTPARFHAFLDRLAQCTLPTIAAISGHVHGGGAELPLACDFRIGVDTLRLQVPATRIGLCYPPPGIRRYTRLLGASVAKRILLAGEVCDTTTLQQIGYLDQSVAPESLASTVSELANRLAALAPLSVSATKELIDRAASDKWSEAVADEWVSRCANSADLKRGLDAARHKTNATFQGD